MLLSSAPALHAAGHMALYADACALLLSPDPENGGGSSLVLSFAVGQCNANHCCQSPGIPWRHRTAAHAHAQLAPSWHPGLGPARPAHGGQRRKFFGCCRAPGDAPGVRGALLIPPCCASARMPALAFTHCAGAESALAPRGRAAGCNLCLGHDGIALDGAGIGAKLNEDVAAWRICCVLYIVHWVMYIV